MGYLEDDRVDARGKGRDDRVQDLPCLVQPGGLDHEDRLVHRLPLERWLCRESRASLSVRELRERLCTRCVQLKGLVERSDLVEALDSVPHETLCSICHEDYVDGEI